MPLRRIGIILCCILFLVLTAQCPAIARDGLDFQPVSQEELKMTSEPLAPGAAAIILYRQVDRDDSSSGKIHEDNYFRIKILTDIGRKFGNIEIPFLKGADEVVHIRARTIKADGTVVPYDGKVFEKSLVKGRKFNYLTKTFTLPDVEVGCIIEYIYTLDLQHAYASHWILSEELFTKNARFSLKPFKGSYVPLTIQRRWQNLPPGARPEEGPDHIFRMEASNIPAFQTEDFMPPANELKSRVDFTYEIGRIEDDSNQFWKRVGKARNDQMEAFVGKRKAMEEASAQIISSGDAPELKLRKIYDRVQQLRNTSFEMQKTQQEQKREKEKVDENVEDVWKRGYGNRWQLDWLFLALVRAAGFDAYGCWVSSRADYFFNPKMMQSGHLNETAVLVKLNGKDLFFSPGAEFAPFGMLNWSETGTPGMRLDKDGGTWIATALPKSSESLVERKAKLKLSDSGDLEGKLTVTYTGLEAMYHRLNVRHADAVARKKSFEDRIRSQVPVAAEAELTNQPDWNGSETPLICEFDLKIPGWASNAGKRVVLPAGVFTAAEKHTFEHANRLYPIYFEYPYEKWDDVTIELPGGWQVGSVPASQEKDEHVVAYNLKVEADKNALHLTRKLKMDFLLLDAKYYPALRTFFASLRTADEQQVVVQPSASDHSN